jgi:hypothetical protein
MNTEVYFAQIENDGPIKIGFTTKGAKIRIANIEQSLPYRLIFLASVVGDKELEKTLHKKYLHAMILNKGRKTEWFHPHSSLKSYIDAIK